MRFYIDEDVTSRPVVPLQGFGYDVVHRMTPGTNPDRMPSSSHTRRRHLHSLLHEAWSYCSSNRPYTMGHAHPGIVVVPNSSRIGDDDLIGIVRGFAETATDAAGRLYRWRIGDGWTIVDRRSTIALKPRSRLTATSLIHCASPNRDRHRTATHRRRTTA